MLLSLYSRIAFQLSARLLVQAHYAELRNSALFTRQYLRELGLMA